MQSAAKEILIPMTEVDRMVEWPKLPIPPYPHYYYFLDLKVQFVIFKIVILLSCPRAHQKVFRAVSFFISGFCLHFYGPELSPTPHLEQNASAFLWKASREICKVSAIRVRAVGKNGKASGLQFTSQPAKNKHCNPFLLKFSTAPI